MPTPDRVAAVLLAAGRSRRFGVQDKLLATLEGRPLAAHIAGVVASMGFASLTAVCAPDMPERADIFAQLGFAVVPGDPYGMSGSLRAGLAHVADTDIDAILVCLADMPRVTVDHIVTLLAQEKGGVVASIDQRGQPMPPALFHRSSFDAIRALGGDAGARMLLAEAARVQAPDGSLHDVDTPGDLDHS